MDKLENENTWEVVPRDKAELLLRLEVNQELVDAIKSEALEINVSDYEDVESYEKAKALHIRLKSLTSKLEENKRAITKPLRDQVSEVNALAKKYMMHLDMAKAHLDKQRKVVEDHERQLKEAEERKEREILEARTKELQSYGVSIPIFMLSAMDESKYQKELEAAKAQHEARRAEQDREAKWKRDLLEKNARLESELKEAKKDELLAEIKKRFPTIDVAWQRILELETEVF